MQKPLVVGVILLIAVVFPTHENRAQGDAISKNEISEPPSIQLTDLVSVPDTTLAAVTIGKSQADLDAEAKAAKAKKATKKAVAPSAVIPDDQQAYLNAVGIPESDWGYVQFIINHEGSWRPCVINGGAIDCTYTGSKAYGICQSKPGNKMAEFGDDWQTNPLTQLKWCNKYAMGYGGWHQAYLAWLSKGWW